MVKPNFSAQSKIMSLKVDNWRELLKANLYKISMLTLKEKSQINNLIQKEKLSKDDKEILISLLCKLKNDELCLLFGKKGVLQEILNKKQIKRLLQNINFYKNPQSESYLSNLIEEIKKLANKKGICLRIFDNLTAKYQKSLVRRKALEGASLILINLIKEKGYPKYVRNKEHYQQLIGGKYYLKKGDSGFEQLANQKNITYGGIIYILRSNIQFSGIFDNIELIYLGRTWKTKKQRFIDHVWDSINSYVERSGENSRYIEKLIILAIKDVIRKNPEINLLIPSLDLLFKNEIYYRDNYYIRNLINKIAELLYNEYFSMEIIEVHKNYETTSRREVLWIRKFHRRFNGKVINGTLYPNGLNMIDHETKLSTLSFPLYDMAFAISLGFIGPEINDMLLRFYNIEIDYTQIHIKIRKFWKNWDHALELFFKPNLQHLLKYQFDWKEIAITLRKHPSYRVKRNFKKWFYGLNITQLKSSIQRKDFRWDDLKKIANEMFKILGDENIIRGFPRDVWIEWFIKDKGMAAIAAETGYKNVAAFRASWIKQNRRSIFQKEFAPSYTKAVQKFRKRRTIELLTNEDFIKTSLGSRLYWIYIYEFNLTRWEDLAVPRPSQGLRNCREFFNKLFKDEGLTFDQLESLNALDSERFNSEF